MSNRFRTGIDANGYTWDDEIQSLIGKNLDNSAGKLDPNWADGTIDIADSTLIGTATHKLYANYQIKHKYRMAGVVRPHFHWLQSHANVPNWWGKWRFWQNGRIAGSWSEFKLATQVFTYTSGKIMQISMASIEIDLTTCAGGEFHPSDFIDFQFTRDTDNSSGLFSGDDPLPEVAQLRAFDPHLQVDSTGSRDEYAK